MIKVLETPRIGSVWQGVARSKGALAGEVYYAQRWVVQSLGVSLDGDGFID